MIEVPFFKPDISRREIAEVAAVLKSGWLTTGPRVRQFERDFAAAVRARHAVALNSCTAALHLSLEALGVQPGQGVLVPTMTFAATAEVVAYLRAVPVLVDCEPSSGLMDFDDAQVRIEEARQGRLPRLDGQSVDVVGMIPVHVGGLMIDLQTIASFAGRHKCWVVEDAAHAFPAAHRAGSAAAWRQCGENTATLTCFSFYANKTITTGEGGMVVTHDEQLARRIRLMSLHGLTNDAWERYGAKGRWDYRIVEPGFKYNLTEIAAAIGLHQLARAEEMRRRREEIAGRFTEALKDLEELELPAVDEHRIHSWHLYPIALRLELLDADRNAILDAIEDRGVKCSVHWRPLHMHPLYARRYGYRPEDLPVAAARFDRIISLPLFPAMTPRQVRHVVDVVRSVVVKHRRAGAK